MSSTAPAHGEPARHDHPTHRHAAHPATLGAVAVGGAVGAMLRWGLELTLPLTDGWPWATLVANVLGSALLAWLVVHDDRRRHPRWVRPALGTGLLGGFTTFSTYAVQVASAGHSSPLVGLALLVLSPALCLAAAALAGTAALRSTR
ncbi:FluC/FEX family fluoride channel [Ornithinimicrobium panacihumi]|uniref:FluC/FEX family fluoride channel n=1 Tax=Ornithinimicrobium panacihumi TaxID=2008449 RepID=UPI003F8BA3CE